MTVGSGRLPKPDDAWAVGVWTLSLRAGLMPNVCIPLTFVSSRAGTFCVTSFAGAFPEFCNFSISTIHPGFTELSESSDPGGFWPQNSAHSTFGLSGS